MENIKFELAKDEVNLILNALAYRQYGEVYTLIEKIMNQSKADDSESEVDML